MYRMKKSVQGPALKPPAAEKTGTKAGRAPGQKVAAKATTASASSDSRRIQVRRSGVHGKGVFALRDIAAGERIIEYKGELISWPEALRRHPHDPKQPNHTFYFHIDDHHVIDANVNGNAARWINHACDPNCESDEQGTRIYIQALRDISAGEELFYDYGLVIDERYTPKLKKEYECRCGSANCRRTMLAPKR
jgi:SET domain-containing protein